LAVRILKFGIFDQTAPSNELKRSEIPLAEEGATFRGLSGEHLMRCRLALAALLLTTLLTPVLARDNGQFGNVPPEVRAWFKSVRSKNGVFCCDIADGHRTDYDM
jgi:hypothetical protein